MLAILTIFTFKTAQHQIAAKTITKNQGFVINKEKSVLQLRQKLVFLGFSLDSILMRVPDKTDSVV